MSNDYSSYCITTSFENTVLKETRFVSVGLVGDLRVQAPRKVILSKQSFLRTMLFSPTSRSLRQAACSVITSLARNTARKPDILDLLTRYST